MFSRNLRYYRLKKNLTKKELARLCDLSPMSITHYENGERMPGMEIINRLSSALDVRPGDFLAHRETDLVFSHGRFRKQSGMARREEDYVRENVEEYMSRFHSVLGILGENVLPLPLPVHSLPLSRDTEKNGRAMRILLGLGETGPVGNLVEHLENKGFLLFMPDNVPPAFSGINGLVNSRPYICVNSSHNPERSRSDIAHELAHLLFIWDEDISEEEQEKKATAIGGAFLLPEKDLLLELGLKRTRVANDMTMVAREYGVSMYLLVKRANQCGIITDKAARDFYITAGKAGWKKGEPSRIGKEVPHLFRQLVFRAVAEDEISIQKAVELLKEPYDRLVEECFGMEEEDGTGVHIQRYKCVD